MLGLEGGFIRGASALRHTKTVTAYPVDVCFRRDRVAFCSTACATDAAGARTRGLAGFEVLESGTRMGRSISRGPSKRSGGVAVPRLVVGPALPSLVFSSAFTADVQGRELPRVVQAHLLTLQLPRLLLPAPSCAVILDALLVLVPLLRRPFKSLVAPPSRVVRPRALRPPVRLKRPNPLFHTPPFVALTFALTAHPVRLRVMRQWAAGPGVVAPLVQRWLFGLTEGHKKALHVGRLTDRLRVVRLAVGSCVKLVAGRDLLPLLVVALPTRTLVPVFLLVVGVVFQRGVLELCRVGQIVCLSLVSAVVMPPTKRAFPLIFAFTRIAVQQQAPVRRMLPPAPDCRSAQSELAAAVRAIRLDHFVLFAVPIPATLVVFPLAVQRRVRPLAARVPHTAVYREPPGLMVPVAAQTLALVARLVAAPPLGNLGFALLICGLLG